MESFDVDKIDAKAIDRAYKESTHFKEFMDAYAVSRRISVDSALRHEVAKNVLKDFISRDKL